MNPIRNKPGRGWLSAWAWLVNLALGLGLGIWWSVLRYLESMGDGREQDAMGNAMEVFLLTTIPFGVISLILWFRRNKRLPSIAFIVTVITGAFFFFFSMAESIGGFSENPVDQSAAIGGLLEIATFALPFFVIAWLLWVKPKIGAVLLMLLGIGMGIWMGIRMGNGWNGSLKSDELLIPAMLVGLPVILGGFTFVKEVLYGNGNMNRNATA